MLAMQEKARKERSKDRYKHGWKPMLTGLILGALIASVIAAGVYRKISAKSAEASALPSAESKSAASSILGSSSTSPVFTRPQSGSVLSGIGAVKPGGQQAAPAYLGDAYDPDAGPLLITSQPLAANAPGTLAAMKALEDYQAAGSPQARMRFVYMPERSLPLMRDYYETQKAADPELKQLLSAAMLSVGESQLIHLNWLSPGRENGASTSFHRTTDGRLVLDWESFTAYSEQSWQRFKTERPPKALMFRAYASLDSYHNYEFDDPERHLSLKLRSPDGNEFVNAYCDARGGLALFLKSLMLAPGGVQQQIPVTLMLAFPPGAKSNHCVRIESFLANRWLLVESERPRG